MREIARRSLLAGISALPALTMAGATQARPEPSEESRVHGCAADADADLIAQAGVVTRLSRLLDRAYERLARKGDAVTAAAGTKPIGPAAQSGACLLDEHAVDPASDVERCFTIDVQDTAGRPSGRQAPACRSPRGMGGRARPLGPGCR